MKKLFLTGLTVLALTQGSAFAANEVTERDALRQRMGVQDYALDDARLSNLKIAILDNGFEGYKPGRGQLPESAELINLTQIAAAPTSHGAGMAQIVWALAGHKAAGPKFYLVNTNGFSNLKAAVSFVIEKKVDIVLYSQVWPFGSNFDGKGFINEQVNKVTAAGIMWINAAGNNGGMVYNGKVSEQRDSATDFMTFAGGRNYLEFENKFDENEVTLTLSWTDFQDMDTYNTSKDLDLFVYDENDQAVGSSDLIQKGEAPKPGESSKLSSHARENLTLTNLDRGKYRIRIKAKSQNFVATDRFRVLLKNERDGSIDFKDHTSDGEIMPPADNASVITVGEAAADTAVGPTSDGRVKPDVLIQDARVSFTNGNMYRGSSTAAALVVGTLALMKAQEATLTFNQVKGFVSSLAGASGSDKAEYVDNANLKLLEPWIRDLIPADAEVKLHRRGNYVVLLNQDPLDVPAIRNSGAYRILGDDQVIASAYDRQWFAFPRRLEYQIRSPMIQFKKKVGGTGVWHTPTPSELKKLISGT